MSSEGVTAARVSSARSVDGLLRELMASDPGRPRVTWYGPDGERVELSAKVLANWVAKTGNLLVEECGVEPDTVVRLDLPMHWRTVVFALAAWSVGATVPDPEAFAPQVDEDGEVSYDYLEIADVHVTTRPPADPEDARVVAVALPALARRFEGQPGDGDWDVDYAAEVSGFADEPVYAVDDDPDKALDMARSLLDFAMPGYVQWPHGSRMLVTRRRWRSPLLVLEALMLDGSVVLVADPEADLDRLAETEQVTVRF